MQKGPLSRRRSVTRPCGGLSHWRHSYRVEASAEERLPNLRVNLTRRAARSGLAPRCFAGRGPLVQPPQYLGRLERSRGAWARRRWVAVAAGAVRRPAGNRANRRIARPKGRDRLPRPRAGKSVGLSPHRESEGGVYSSPWRIQISRPDFRCFFSI